jgi:Acyl dehydratase
MGKTYEEISLGEKFVTPGRTITEADVVAFAGLTGDYNSIHTDEMYSRKFSIFKTRIAHGLLAFSIAEGLFCRLGWFDTVPAISIGYEELKFLKPVLIGDTIRFEGEVTEKRESKSRRGWGIIKTKVIGRNQRGEQIMEFTHSYLVPKREVLEVMK